MSDLFVFDVGYSPGRMPLTPDAKVSRVYVAAESFIRAQILAAQIVAGHCAMVTSTTFVYAEV